MDIYSYEGDKGPTSTNRKDKANHNILTTNILLLHYTSSRRYDASLRFAGRGENRSGQARPDFERPEPSLR